MVPLPIPHVAASQRALLGESVRRKGGAGKRPRRRRRCQAGLQVRILCRPAFPPRACCSRPRPLLPPQHRARPEPPGGREAGPLSSSTLILTMLCVLTYRQWATRPTERHSTWRASAWPCCSGSSRAWRRGSVSTIIPGRVRYPEVEVSALASPMGAGFKLKVLTLT